MSSFAVARRRDLNIACSDECPIIVSRDDGRKRNLSLLVYCGCR